MKYCEVCLFLQLMFMDVSTKEVNCEGEQLINVDTVVGNPGIAPPYKPGHILVFRCTDVNLKMYGQRTIECLSNGKWDLPFPKCGDVTCPLHTTENNIKIKRFPDLEGPVKPGHNLTFSCNGQGLILTGQREITCQSNGEWSNSFPKCETRTECGPPPHQENADTEEMPKSEYSFGEKVKYMCYNKFTMEGYPYLTCAQGEWRGYFMCLKPCTVTLEEMDRRGIELQWGGRQKIFSPHKDTISFACQTGKYLTDETDLRQTCTNGVMLLPQCA